MAMGKRQRRRQKELLVPAAALRSPGHPFYEKLNGVLAKAGFDDYVEELCSSSYEAGGRPSIPPGIYFRMLFVGYFEGLDSQRGIAWRCGDSLSLRQFLGLEASNRVPDHSSLTRIRQRLSLEQHHEVFAFVIRIAKEHGLVRGRTVGVDATTIEANAAMKTIVRKASGETWDEYVKRLAEEEEIDDPDDDAQRRNFDRKRKKKVSNDEWESKSDPDARIARMKDGQTRLAYKAEYAVDLDTDIVVGATVDHAGTSDGETIKESLALARAALEEAGAEATVEATVADKGYHKAETLAWCEERGIRTYIPELKRNKKRRWKDKPERWARAYRNNARRVRSTRGRAMQRRRSEMNERTVAHVCRTGGARRTWIRGLVEVEKRHLMQVAACNLGRILRAAFGFGTPRQFAAAIQGLMAILTALIGRLRLARSAPNRIDVSVAENVLQLRSMT